MSQPNARSFPLLKVSLATDPTEAKKWNWRHETRDVRLMFDSYGCSNSYQQHMLPILSVMQDTTILERVDLAEKIREAEDSATRARQGGKRLKPDDIPTTALHKRLNCAIAIRYPFSETKIRRLQLKFESVQDFDRALIILQDLGCYLRDHEGRIPSDMLPNWPASRPTSALASSSAHLLNASTSIGHEQSQHPPVYSAHFRPTSTTPLSSHSFSQLQRSSTLHPPQFGDPLRPSTPLFPIQEDESVYADPVIENIGGLDPKAPLDDLTRRRATAINLHHTGNDCLTSPRQARPSTATDSHGIASSSFIGSIRPSTTSKVTIAQLDNDLSSMIPPRRELPFKRPGSRQSVRSQDGSTSRPSSSIDLPALPRPSFINPLLIESSIAPSSINLQNSSATKDSTSTLQDDTILRQEGVKVPAFRNPSSKKPTLSGGTQSNKGWGTVATVAKVGSRPSTAISAGSPNVMQLGTTSATGNTPLASQSLEPDLYKALGKVGSTMASTAPISIATIQGAEMENLATYVAMPYEKRMAVLEKLIVDGVSDENFVTLCEDVYGCWQRIGFGC